MDNTFNLHFGGSISDANRGDLPSYCGIYLVYRGVYNKEKNNFACRVIIYIGQADNINDRHKNHEKRAAFLAKCGKDEIIFYSYVKVDKYYLDRVENALVFKMCPSLNDKLTQTFPYDETTIVSDGACALLNKNFTLQRKDQ